MFAALGKYLNSNVVGNEVLLNKRAAEGIFGLAGGREAYFDLLEADLDKVFPEFQLFLQ